MKKKYCAPKLNSITLDTDIVLMLVSDNQHQHRHRYRHHGNNKPTNNPFGGSKPFPDSPQYDF